MRRIAAALAFLIALSACAAGGSKADLPNAETRVLLFGNSLSYTFDLPSMLRRLMTDSTPSRATVVPVLRPGAHIYQYLDDQTLPSMVANLRPTHLVLQDFGGELLCIDASSEAQDPTCRRVIDGYLKIARIAESVDAKLVILGTYQRLDTAGVSLSNAERWLAARTGAEAIDLNAPQRAAMQAITDGSWFAPDGMHPGADATYLAANLLCESIVEAGCRTAAFHAQQSRAGEFSSTTGTRIVALPNGEVREVNTSAINALKRRP